MIFKREKRVYKGGPVTHIVDIRKKCMFWPGCVSLATHELLNRYNATVGYYCKKHAEKRLKELKADEAEEKEKQ